MSIESESGRTPAPRRGRPPRRKPTSDHHPGLPMETDLSGLSPTARNLLTAARSILVERGMEALTIESVALESGEDRGAVAYHFGSKAGLVEALFDSLVHDAYVVLMADTLAAPPGRERLRRYVEGLHGILQDVEAWRAFYEIAPYALRDSQLRPRMAALYEWYRELTLRTCGLTGESGEIDDDQMALASVVVAALDGLAFQYALDPEGFDRRRPFEMLYRCVTAVLDAEASRARPPRTGPSDR